MFAEQQREYLDKGYTKIESFFSAEEVAKILELTQNQSSEGLGPMFQHALALQAEAAAAEQASALEASYFTRYAQHWLAQATPYAGVPALLAELKSQGLLLGLCSNRDRPSIEALLACTGLDIGFDAVVGLGDEPDCRPDLLSMISQWALVDQNVHSERTSAKTCRVAQEQVCKMLRSMT